MKSFFFYDFNFPSPFLTFSHTNRLALQTTKTIVRSLSVCSNGANSANGFLLTPLSPSLPFSWSTQIGLLMLVWKSGLSLVCFCVSVCMRLFVDLISSKRMAVVVDGGSSGGPQMNGASLNYPLSFFLFFV